MRSERLRARKESARFATHGGREAARREPRHALKVTALRRKLKTEVRELNRRNDKAASEFLERCATQLERRNCERDMADELFQHMKQLDVEEKWSRA